MKSSGYRESRFTALGIRWNRGGRFIAYVLGEVTQVSRITEVHLKVQVKSPVYRGSRFCAPGTRQNRGANL